MRLNFKLMERKPTEDNPEELKQQAKELYNKGLALLEDLEKNQTKYNKIEGIEKFRRRVQAEIDFLNNLITNPAVVIKKTHVNCTNLYHYSAVYETFSTEKHVVAVFKVFDYYIKNKIKKVEVDVVSYNGGCWIKVKAMKASSVHSISIGDSSYGEKSINDFVEELIGCAKQHEVHFVVPVVVVRFSKGITEDVAEELHELGAIVHGPLYDEENQPVTRPDLVHPHLLAQLEAMQVIEYPRLVNLDVTALINISSDVTNGGAFVEFEDEILNMQAKEEQAEPSVPKLMKFLEGREVFITKTAHDKFLGLLELVGGEKEIKRGKEFVARLKVIDDDPSERVLRLKNGAKIQDQHKKIFGTGDKLKAITVTGNRSFVAATEHAGVSLSIFYQPARALTEQKALFTQQQKDNNNTSANTSSSSSSSSAANIVE